MKPSRGMDILFIECLDTTQKGYLRWNIGLVRSSKIVTGKPFILGEQHVREDCDGYIPTAKEWFTIVENKQRPTWATRTQKLEFED